MENSPKASDGRVSERISTDFLGDSPKKSKIFREVSVKNYGIARLSTDER